MKPKIWTEVDLHPAALERLAAYATVDRGGRPADLPGAVAAIISASRVDADFIARAGPELRLVVRHGIGYNTLDIPAISAQGVLAANTPDAPSESTAEHTVALMLALTKRIVEADTVMRANRPWTRAGLRGVELRGRTLGVVGYGRIGRRVAAICALGFEMPVLVYDPFAGPEAATHPGITFVASLEALLAGADILTVHTPLTAATERLIGARELGLMRTGSFLINASRGPVIDEVALIAALERGQLAGAALDVFDPEPPAPTNPLLSMPQVVVTPHVASNTDRGILRMSQGVVDQILQVLRGERPAFLIDSAAWPGRMAADLR